MSSLFNNAIFVSSPQEVPPGEHWAILEFSSVTIPGDLRSQQAPGHGYPEHQEQTMKYVAFTRREDFEAEMQARFSRHAYHWFCGVHITEKLGIGVHISVQTNA